MDHNSFIRLADGGFALHTGRAALYEGWFMLRTDAGGNVVWSDRLDFVGEQPMDVAELPNGDLVFSGVEGSFGFPELVLRKDGLTGATEWMHWYSPGVDEYIDLYGMATAPDSTIVLSGIISTSTYADAFAMALAADGTPLWSTRFGTDDTDIGDDIAAHPDGGFVVTGIMWDSPGSTDILGGYVTRLDADGQVVWSRHVDKPDVLYVVPTRCAIADDGGVLLAGRCARTNDYAQYFQKLDADGNSCPTCPSVAEGSSNPVTITQVADQGYAFAGPWATAATPLTFIVADLTATTAVEVCGSTGVEDVPSTTTARIAPNPFTDRTVITVDPRSLNGIAQIELRDVLGRLVHTQTVQGTSTIMERGAISAGRYAYRITDKEGMIATGALVVGE